MPSLFDRNIIERSASQHFQNQFLKEAKRKRENRGRTENLEDILKIYDIYKLYHRRKEKKENGGGGRRSETEVVTESIHKFTTTFHLPDFCQLSFLSYMFHFILFGYIPDTYPLAFLYQFLLSIS